eukprot:m.182203 g.182203  ORF g.182203 m.182203 type:complete len:1141 (-) comp32100_c0_seq5:140-3562(-)
MGVPSFYKWLASKYPKSVEYVKEDPIRRDQEGEKIPPDTSQPNPNGEFDNLYLDMNGIIHPASHPEDGPAPQTEDDMYLAIFEYIDRVFSIIRPRKVLFMGIDGVAPRAKMNQQRSRRFRAAQERTETMEKAEELRQELRDRGVDVPPAPEDPPFDSNVITPGTPFMARLAEFLRWFIRYKIQHDSGWKGIKVILSDASIPGEGEHKIMDYIRLQRCRQGYDPNTRHVIHGLDADLIMLALATHDPHFFILREEVTFGKPQTTEKNAMDLLDASGKLASGEAVEDVLEEPPKPFQIIKISILREYLQKEFSSGDYRTVGGFNLERTIDDFILMCFFVGNDFLPHLPSMEIREGAIDTIIDLYKTIFNELGGYMTENGKVRISAVQLMMKELGSIEDEVLGKRRAQEERFNGRQKQKEIDLKNRKASKDHLDLIRRFTVADADMAVAIGKPNSASLAAEPSVKRAKVEPATDHTKVSSAAFRIKNRGPGGVRVIAPGVTDRDVKILHLFDKIREFSERTNRKGSLPLKNLNGYERARAHDYAEELELSHKGKGEDPNRYIQIEFKNSYDTSAEHTTEEKQDYFEQQLKSKIMAENDAVADTMTDTVELGKPGWKTRYYTEKVPGDKAEDLARCYLEGLMWVMRYYYSGCPSWNWFYPYHYAPFASDLVDIKIEENFTLGSPFKPFEQLMSVFPPASSHALPTKLAALMNGDSVIGEFYPTEFALDLNGKRRMWQAIVLLPFIEEKKLLTHIKPLEDELVGEESDRNKFGATKLYAHESHQVAKLLKAAPAKPPNVPRPSLEKMNDLAAAHLKAELNGDEAEQLRIEKELEETRSAAAAFLASAGVGKGLPLDPTISQGMNGFVLEDPDGCALGENFEAPVFEGHNRNHKYLPTDVVNKVVSVEYSMPEYQQHITSLLPGLVEAKPELSTFDNPILDQKFIRARKSQQQQHGQFNTFGMQRHQSGMMNFPAKRMIQAGLGGPGPAAFNQGNQGYQSQPHQQQQYPPQHYSGGGASRGGPPMRHYGVDGYEQKPQGQYGYQQNHRQQPQRHQQQQQGYPPRGHSEGGYRGAPPPHQNQRSQPNQYGGPPASGYQDRNAYDGGGGSYRGSNSYPTASNNQQGLYQPPSFSQQGGQPYKPYYAPR